MSSYYRKKYAKKNRGRNRKEDLIVNIVAVITIILFVFFLFEWNGKEVKKVEIDIADVKSFRIPYKSYGELERLAQQNHLNFGKVMTIFALENQFFSNHTAMSATGVELESFIKNYKQIEKQYPKKKIADYENMMNNIYNEMRYFPIAKGYDEYSFQDSYGSERTYGGKRIHEGTDIMDKNSMRGRIPIVSMTDGVIENIGWNEKGGFRIGIRSESDTYYYYAHFDHFEPSLKKGSQIAAGDLLGYMGDSGYSKVEGTKGIFPVHLHIGISPIFGSEEFWINPYVFLRHIENKRTDWESS